MEYENKFIEGKNVSYKDIVFNLVLDKLELSQLEITDLSEIKGLRKLKNLGMLYLDSNQIAEIKELDGLSNLYYLNLGCNNISEIKGLENLVNLKILDLSFNQITEIKGLNKLCNLEDLNLNHNRISDITGLENLNKLKFFSIGDNPIHQAIISHLGDLNEFGQAKDTKKFIEYCNQKRNGVAPRIRTDTIKDYDRKQDKIRELNLKVNSVIQSQNYYDLDYAKKLNEIDETGAGLACLAYKLFSESNFRLTSWDSGGLRSNKQTCYILFENKFEGFVGELGLIKDEERFEVLVLHLKIPNKIQPFSFYSNLKGIFLLYNKPRIDFKDWKETHKYILEMVKY